MTPQPPPAAGVPRTAGDPLSPETEEYLALRKRGLRLPSRADLLQRLDDCEEALRLAEAAAQPALDAPCRSCSCPVGPDGIWEPHRLAEGREHE